jgi:hypothetical protein
MIQNEKMYRRGEDPNEGLFFPVLGTKSGRIDFIPTKLNGPAFNRTMFSFVAPELFWLMDAVFHSQHFRYVMGAGLYAEGGQQHPVHQVWHSDASGMRSIKKKPHGEPCGEDLECQSGFCDKETYSCESNIHSSAEVSEATESGENDTEQYWVVVFLNQTRSGQIEVLPGCFGGGGDGVFECQDKSVMEPTADNSGEFLEHIEAGTVLIHSPSLAHRGRAYTGVMPRFTWRMDIMKSTTLADFREGKSPNSLSAASAAAFPRLWEVHEQRYPWFEQRRWEVLRNVPKSEL